MWYIKIYPHIPKITNTPQNIFSMCNICVHLYSVTVTDSQRRPTASVQHLVPHRAPSYVLRRSPREERGSWQQGGRLLRDPSRAKRSQRSRPTGISQRLTNCNSASATGGRNIDIQGLLLASCPLPPCSPPTLLSEGEGVRAVENVHQVKLEHFSYEFSRWNASMQ